jgi:hypothetical protein
MLNAGEEMEAAGVNKGATQTKAATGKREP